LVSCRCSPLDAAAAPMPVPSFPTRRSSGLFAIDAHTGQVTVAGAIDREADGPSLDIVVRATSADGSHADQTFTIAINDVNEFAVSTPAHTYTPATAHPHTPPPAPHATLPPS